MNRNFMQVMKNNKKGMELVQVGILIAIAIGIGLIFKTQITEFINGTFSNLMNSGF
ncbi:MAG: Flp1 family type IVb pilin [Anaerovoracaceae bacterium]